MISLKENILHNVQELNAKAFLEVFARRIKKRLGVYTKVAKISKLLAINLTLIICCINVNVAHAEDISEAKINRLKGEIKSLQTWLDKAEGKRSSAEDDLKQSELQISKLAKEIQKNAVLSSNLQKQVAKLRKEETTLVKKRQREAIYLSKQIRAAYSMGKQEYLKVLLNQQNPDRVSRLLRYYDYINKERSKNIQAYLETAEELAKVKNKILDKNQKVISAHKKLLEHQKELKKEQRNHIALVNNLSKDIKGKGKELDKLKKDQIRLEALLAAVSQTITQIPPPTDSLPFASMKGKLKLPIKGKIITGFGGYLFAGKLRSHGMLISAKVGDNVKAIHGGRVIFSDWIRGFGMMIIIDHGNGYMSVYGHNQSLFSNIGDWIKGGQIIAQAGTSGGLNQPSLYFEIRHKGQPINPVRWLAKR